MTRPIDHLVLAVPDLAVAAATYRALGFSVGSVNRHPWGTVNAVVRLAGCYLELISIEPGFVPPKPDDPARHFASPVADAVARGGGLPMLAFGSDDADADQASFVAAGIGSGRRLDFSRDALGADGSARILRFGLVFVDAPALGSVCLFTCRHHQPFGDASMPQHSNGALRLDDVVLEVDTIDHCCIPVLEAVVGAAPHGPANRPSFATATGRVDVVSLQNERSWSLRHRPVPPRFRSFSIGVEDLGRVHALLKQAGVSHGYTESQITVSATSLFGVALAFVPAGLDAVA